MKIEDVNRKNIMTFSPREINSLDDDLLNSKVSDLTVKQLIVILRMVKSNIKISRTQNLINAEQTILTHIRLKPTQTNREICNSLGIGINIVQYYTNKLMDDKKIVGISIKPGSKVRGFILTRDDKVENVPWKEHTMTL